jgi:hypothetical protein
MFYEKLKKVKVVKIHMVCETFKTMVKYGALQLAIAMVMVGVAINLLPLTVIGSILLTIMSFFLIRDKLLKRGKKLNSNR